MQAISKGEGSNKTLFTKPAWGLDLAHEPEFADPSPSPPPLDSDMCYGEKKEKGAQKGWESWGLQFSIE